MANKSMQFDNLLESINYGLELKGMPPIDDASDYMHNGELAGRIDFLGDGGRCTHSIEKLAPIDKASTLYPYLCRVHR